MHVRHGHVAQVEEEGQRDEAGQEGSKEGQVPAGGGTQSADESRGSLMRVDLTYNSITISWTTASERKRTKAHIRSNRKCVSGWARYMASRGVLRYHMVNGFSSVGGQKKLKLKHLRSGGSKFDSIMAMLCVQKRGKNEKDTQHNRVGLH